MTAQASIALPGQQVPHAAGPRYRFELATLADEPELRRVLRLSPMPGMISLCFQREPDYFQAQVVEGHLRQALLARDAATGAIVALAARAIADRFVNGVAQPVGYLSNLRVLPSYRRGAILGRGYDFLRQLHRDGHTRLYLTTITQDNTVARDVLTAGRGRLPAYHAAGRFHTVAIPLPRRRKPAPHHGAVTLRHAQAGDAPMILDFLQRVGRRCQFFPRYSASDIFADHGLLHGLEPQDLLLALRTDRLVGTLGAWNQQAFRQTVIHGYGQPLRALRPLYNISATLRGWPALPPPGAPLRCLMGALPLVDGDDPRVFAALLETLLARRAATGADYFLVGLHESNPLLQVLQHHPARRYTTCLYVVCWEDGEASWRTLDARPIYLELGSL